jgi:probable HAF family extracellular repeat protein
MQDIGTLGGSWSEAYGVSDNGLVVVGRAINTGGQWRAFLWDVIDEMHNLSTLPGYDRESVAYGVSGDGTMVVGASYNSRGESHAFLWDTKRGMQDLNVLYDYLRKDSSILLEARTITPNGRYIVGVGYRVSRQRYEAYLLDTQGTSSVDDGSEGEVTITISPQPFAEQGWVQVRLGRFEQARVEVRDMLGRLVTVLDEGVLGEQRWQLPQLAAGVYTVVVRTGHGVSARQFVVTR